MPKVRKDMGIFLHIFCEGGFAFDNSFYIPKILETKLRNLFCTRRLL